MAVKPEYEGLKTNIKFLELVEKYDCLWNHDSPYYTNVPVKGQAWKEIATAVNGTEERCCRRWRYIRQAYSTYVRSSLKDDAKVQKYYLSPYIDFVRPYVKVPACNNQPHNTRDKTEILLEQQFLDLIEGTREKNTKSTVQLQKTPTASSSFTLKRKNESNGSAQPKPPKHSKTDLQQSCVSQNWMFLESSLTFVDEMSKTQIRRFRRKVMMLLNDILENKNIDKPELCELDSRN